MKKTDEESWLKEPFKGLTGRYPANEHKTINGEPIPELQDGVVLPPEEGWFAPTVNPFLHVCCDCKLAHKVEFCLTDREGNQLPFPEGVSIALRFSRDQEETEHLRINEAVEPIDLMREVEKEGYFRWPTDKAWDTEENLKKYDFVEVGWVLYAKEK